MCSKVPSYADHVGAEIEAKSEAEISTAVSNDEEMRLQKFVPHNNSWVCAVDKRIYS